MATTEPTNTADLEQWHDELKQLKLSLPREIWFGNSMQLYQGFWFLDLVFEGIIAFQNHFRAYDTDIILASLPKTGTTWLKSLLFTIVNRKNSPNILDQHPFHTNNPHELVPHLEQFTHNDFTQVIGKQPDSADASLPRLFATHCPHSSLPESIKTSKCRLVYVYRNPLDTFVSAWHYFLQFEICKGTEPSMEVMEEYLDKYCKGVSPYGPHDQHMLGYWKESQQNPHKVLFLEYEGLKKEPKAHLIRLAEFVGCPFSEDEKEVQVVDGILELCSLNSMKEMEVNKSGSYFPWVENKFFFRKGEIGDWSNHLTLSMAERFDQMQLNLKEAGFTSTYI